MSVEKIRVMVEGYGDIDVDKNIRLLDLAKKILIMIIENI